MNDELVVTIRAEDFQALHDLVQVAHELLQPARLVPATVPGVRGLLSGLVDRLATMPRSPARHEQADWPLPPAALT